MKNNELDSDEKAIYAGVVIALIIALILAIAPW